MIAKKLLTTIAFALVLLFSGCAKDDFNEVDGVCPVVVSTIPEDSAINVPLNQVITVPFNEKMNPTTISKTSFTVAANGALIDGTVTYNNLTATFTPTLPLSENTEYTGTITTMAKDERGNALQEDYVWTFTTVLLLDFTVDVSSSPALGGVTTGGGSFKEGTSITVTATANTGYTFVNWTSAGVEVSTIADYTFDVIANTTLVANFEINTYILTVTSVNGTVLIDPIQTTYDFGTLVSLTPAPAAGYEFTSWSGDATGIDIPLTVLMNADKNITANFSLIGTGFTLNVTAQNGKVSKNPEKLTYNNGDSVILTPTPDPNYVFDSWSGDATGNNNPLTVTMNSNKNITANFILSGVATGPGVIDLGTAGDFVILAKTGISTTGVTSITGNIGVSPNSQGGLTGFSETMDASGEFSTSTYVDGNIYAADYSAPTPTYLSTAISDQETAFTTANGLTTNVIVDLGAGDISGKTLAPGLYKWGTGLLITNQGVTLSGGPDDTWVFQISDDFTIDNDAIITLAGGAQAKNIFWITQTQALLGSNVQFKGNILAQTLISVNTGATVNGVLLSQTAVTLNTSTVVKP